MQACNAVVLTNLHFRAVFELSSIVPHPVEAELAATNQVKVFIPGKLVPVPPTFLSLNGFREIAGYIFFLQTPLEEEQHVASLMLGKCLQLHSC